MQLNFLARHAIQTRVTLSTMAIFLASLWSLSFYASVGLKNDLRDKLSAQQFATVSLLAQQVDERLVERLHWLQLLAMDITAQQLSHPAALQRPLDQQHPLSRTEFNEGVLVVNLDGAAIAETPVTAGRVGQGRMNVQLVSVALKQAQVSIGQVFMDAHRGAPMLSMSAPVRDTDGRVIGAVIGLTNLKMPNFLRSITDTSYGKTGGYVLMDPAQRRVITATDPRRIMETLPSPGVSPALDRVLHGYQGSLLSINPDGEEILTSDKLVPSTGWIISAMLPTKEADAPMHSMQQRMRYATWLLTLLAGALTWWLIRHQLAPVRNTIEAIGQRQLSAQAPQALPLGAPGEIGELIRAFNSLLAALTQRNEKLLAQQDVLSRIEALAHIGSWEWDIASNTVTWSDELFQFFRMTPDTHQPSMEQLPKLYIPQDAQRFKKAVNKALLYGIPYELELRSMRQDGSQRYYLACAEVQHNAQHEVSKLLGSLQDITDLKQIQETLQHSYLALQAVLKTTPDGFFRADKQGRLLQVNPAYCAMSGYTEEELITMTVLDLEANDQPEEVAARIVHLYRTGREQFETRHRRKDGSLWDLEASLTVTTGGNGEMFVFVRDITERKQAQLHLEMSANVFSHAHEGIGITDIDGVILNVNDTFCQITGYSRAEVIGKHTRLLKSERQDRAFYEALWKALLVNGHWSGEIWNRRKNGEIYPELLTISAVRDEQGVTRQYVALFSDISARKAAEDRVRQLAFFDALTELPNRRLLTDRLNQILRANKRNGHFGAVMFLDLDNFKPLNDSHGHAVGDQLLVEVAQRLKACVREVDTVARLGGDEFVVVLSELDTTLASSQLQAMAVAEKIRQSLSEVYRLKRSGHSTAVDSPIIEHHCTASVGVTVFDPDQTDQQSILHQADAAMYRAKEAGRNHVVLRTDVQSPP